MVEDVIVSCVSGWNEGDPTTMNRAKLGLRLDLLVGEQGGGQHRQE